MELYRATGLLFFYTPTSGKLKRGILVAPCPSVQPSVRLWTESMSALYLQQYLPDPFHIYTSYQATSVGVSHVICFFFFFFFKIKEFEFLAISLNL